MIIEICDLFYDKHSLRYDNILSAFISLTPPAATTDQPRITKYYRNINQTVKMGPSYLQQYSNNNQNHNLVNGVVTGANVHDGNYFFGYDLYKFQISPPEALAILLIGFALTTNNIFTIKTMSQIFYHIRHITYQIGDHLLTFLKNVFDIILFIIFIICMPFTFVVCGALWLYKKCIMTIIRHKVGVKVFRGVMEGTDTVWAIEDDVSKSIITILLTIKVDAIAKAKICGRYNITDMDSNRGVMEVFLSTFRNRMKLQMKLHEKLIYLKRALYGYNFWCMNYDFHMDQYVRFMDITKETRHDFDALQNIISSLSNSNLPHNNEAMWEILVSPEPFHLNRNSHGVREAEYPIIFRVHHAIGDGVALLEFFIKTFCDSSCVLEYEREMNYMKMLYSRKAKEMKKWAVLNGLMAIIKLPSILLSLSTRKVDHNRIHSGGLSGNKLISFYSEKYENHENPRRKLINIVKDRKNHQTDTTFLEVILACVTTGFKKYFEVKQFKVPRILTAVLPVRFGDTSETNLRNSFTVALQTLPIQDQNPETIEQNIKNVQQYTKSIHRYDYMVNYWIMSFLSGLLPSYILRHILYSKHSTLAISNLMGPSCQLTILDCTIDLLTFWLPNRGLTGVGISIFSYNGSLQMGIVADKNRVGSKTDLNLILDITKNYLYDMDKY